MRESRLDTLPCLVLLLLYRNNENKIKCSKAKVRFKLLEGATKGLFPLSVFCQKSKMYFSRSYLRFPCKTCFSDGCCNNSFYSTSEAFVRGILIGSWYIVRCEVSVDCMPLSPNTVCSLALTGSINFSF